MSKVSKSDTTRSVLNEQMLDAYSYFRTPEHALSSARNAAEFLYKLNTLPTELHKNKKEVATFTRRKGKGELKLTDIGKFMLDNAPHLWQLGILVKEKEYAFAPSVVALLDSLHTRSYVFAKDTREIECAKAADPMLICDALNKVAESFKDTTTTRQHLYSEAARSYQIATYQSLVKTTFLAHSCRLHKPKVIQFDLLATPIDGDKKTNLDDLIQQLVKDRDALKAIVDKEVGPDNYCGAFQLMAYPSGYGFHCTLMVSLRYHESPASVVSMLCQEMAKCKITATLFDTCSQNSPFQFRGLPTEQAQNTPLSDRISNIATYLACSTELIACGWPSVHREKLLVGPLVSTQPNVKLPTYRTSGLQDFQARVLSTSADAPAVSGQPTLTPTAWAA